MNIDFKKARRLIQLVDNTPTKDSIGGNVSHETIYASVHAIKTQTNGSEQYDIMRIQSGIDESFIIRYRTDVKPTHLVRWNNKNYNIQRLTNVNDENRFLKIYCTAAGS